MKKVILVLVVLLILAIVIPARADSWTQAVTGTVTSVKHLSDTSAALIFTLQVPEQCGITTVYASGVLAAKWDSRVRRGIILTVTGTQRDNNSCAIDAVSISR